MSIDYPVNAKETAPQRPNLLPEEWAPPKNAKKEAFSSVQMKEAEKLGGKLEAKKDEVKPIKKESEFKDNGLKKESSFKNKKLDGKKDKTKKSDGKKDIEKKDIYKKETFKKGTLQRHESYGNGSRLGELNNKPGKAEANIMPDKPGKAEANIMPEKPGKAEANIMPDKPDKPGKPQTKQNAESEGSGVNRRDLPHMPDYGDRQGRLRPQGYIGQGGRLGPEIGRFRGRSRGRGK